MGRRVVSDKRHGGGDLESLGSGHKRSRQSGPGNGGGSRKTENGLSQHCRVVSVVVEMFPRRFHPVDIGVFLLVGRLELYFD